MEVRGVLEVVRCGSRMGMTTSRINVLIMISNVWKGRETVKVGVLCLGGGDSTSHRQGVCDILSARRMIILLRLYMTLIQFVEWSIISASYDCLTLYP